MLKAAGFASMAVSLLIWMYVGIVGQVRYPIFNAFAAIARMYHDNPNLLLAQVITLIVGMVCLIVARVRYR